MEHAFIADTNLFFECKSLEDLPWSELKVDTVVIALTKPVLSEIDKHKKASGRTRDRAIEIFGRIRKILDADLSEVVIKDAGPRVLLRLIPIVQPDPELANSLDYTINDDRIVGIVSAILKEGAFASVTMITDDMGAAATTKIFGLELFLIPDSWK
jgi:predicted ribonuclease YlaK